MINLYLCNRSKTERNENEKVHCIFPVLHQHDYADSACHSPSSSWRRHDLYEKRPAVRRVLPPSRRLQRTLLLRYRLHDHPFLPTDPQSEQQRHTALLRMGNHPICGTSSQTPDPARRNRHKARVYLLGISAWHVHHTCHRTSRAPFRSCLTHIAERNSFPGRRIYATWLHATFSNFVFQ